MLVTMFQHPGMVHYALYLALTYARALLFKESTSSFLLVNLRVFNRELDHLWFPEEVLST